MMNNKEGNTTIHVIFLLILFSIISITLFTTLSISGKYINSSKVNINANTQLELASIELENQLEEVNFSSININSLKNTIEKDICNTLDDKYNITCELVSESSNSSFSLEYKIISNNFSDIEPYKYVYISNKDNTLNYTYTKTNF